MEHKKNDVKVAAKIAENEFEGYSDLPNGAAKVIPLTTHNSRKRGAFLEMEAVFDTILSKTC